MTVIIGQGTTQLKETGRLHVTVRLTYPAPAPNRNREAPSDSRGDSKARELGRKKNIKGVGVRGWEERRGEGPPRSPSPASIPGPHPHPSPATASGRLDRRAGAGASHLRALCKAGDVASGARLTLALPGHRSQTNQFWEFQPDPVERQTWAWILEKDIQEPSWSPTHPPTTTTTAITILKKGREKNQPQGAGRPAAGCLEAD
ncbi:uncharacterized protein [Eulemur rufifrons]|uniref:uncharacterized protein n=1 Tax=Eulemur rufifrons TaxID=859984 RepID=UPI00374337A9